MKEKISVIVAIYNIEQYLVKCIESLISQTYDNLEIILMDDGSTDASGEICDKYAKKDKRIKVVHQKNQGLSMVRNNGIKMAAGKYVILVDGDDFVERKYVERLFRQLEKNDADIAVCGYKIEPNGKVEYVPSVAMDGEEATIRLLTEQENYQIVSWNKIYKKELFDGIIFPAGKKHEDTLTTYKIMAKARKVVFVSDPLYYYVQREDSIMGKVELESRLKIKLEAAREAKKYFANDENLKAAAEIFELLATYNFLNEIIAGKLNLESRRYFDWIRLNRKRLLKNKYLTQKLRAYILMSTFASGFLYKIFRTIKK